MTRSPFTRSPLARLAGLTLVEVLIAMVMTLIVMFAMMEAFKYASGEMQKSRAVIEMSSQLRSAQELLRSDLEHITLDPKPWTQTALPKGYFEYVEGPRRDATGSLASEKANYSYLGDIDDIISFTVNRPEQPFRGRYNGNIIESPMAEIIWWTHWDDRNGNNQVDFDESVSVYRRVLLIRPDLNDAQTGHLGAPASNADFLKYNDVSVGTVGNCWSANSLEDLGNRGNRFCHFIENNPATANGFPHILMRSNLIQSRMAANNVATGDDVVLTNIAAFDVRVYSPNATVNVVNNLAIEPNDVLVATGAPIVSPGPTYGAFVDLAHGRSAASWFGGLPDDKSKLAYPFYLDQALTEYVYDTWTPFYENDGLDTNQNTDIDEGTNGVNDGGTPAVDETAERETMPPYPHPIRGLKVSLRLVEKNTKQVRQASVIHSFVPE